MAEQYYQTKIMKALRKDHNAYAVNGQYSVGGIPDVIAGVPLTKEQALHHFKTNKHLLCFLGVEVKKPETMADTSPLQEYNLGQIQSLGGFSLIASSPADVADYLSTIKGQSNKTNAIL